MPPPFTAMSLLCDFVRHCSPYPLNAPSHRTLPLQRQLLCAGGAEHRAAAQAGAGRRSTAGRGGCLLPGLWDRVPAAGMRRVPRLTMPSALPLAPCRHVHSCAAIPPPPAPRRVKAFVYIMLALRGGAAGPMQDECMSWACDSVRRCVLYVWLWPRAQQAAQHPLPAAGAAGGG